MKRLLQNILIVLLLAVSLTGSLKAQEPVDTVGSFTGIEVSTAVDKADIYIGDLITYTLTITYDSSLTLEPPPLGANLGAFDVKDFQPDKERKLEDGRIENTTLFKLSTFTTGDYVIPPIPVFFKLPDGSRKVLLSEGVPIKVQSLLFNTDDSADIKPLKSQYEFEPDKTIYVASGLTVLLLAAIIYAILWYRKRRRWGAEIVDTREPWEIASEKLALLKQSGLVENRQFKEYYFLLTELYREYLGKIYKMNYLDMTTDEFREAFQLVEATDNIYERTLTLFRHADLVKFAKMIPERDRCDTDFENIHQMIEQTRIAYIRKQEKETNLPDKTASSSGERKFPDNPQITDTPEAKR